MYIRKPVFDQKTGEYVVYVMPTKSPIAEPSETIRSKTYEGSWNDYRRALKMKGVFN